MIGLRAPVNEEPDPQLQLQASERDENKSELRMMLRNIHTASHRCEWSHQRGATWGTPFSRQPSSALFPINCIQETSSSDLMHGGVDEARAAPLERLEDRRQQVTLSVLLRMAAQGQDQLDHFLHSRPEPTSISFLSWLADQATLQESGLEPLCEYLVLWRERREEERMDELYSSSLESLLDDVSRPDDDGHEALVEHDKERLRTLLVNNPDLMAAQLAEKLTGEPVLSSGVFEDPVLELALQSSPFPASLSPEGVKRSHSAASELALDLATRRKRAVTSMIGRAKLTSEQADSLMAGTAASRILRMILSLPQRDMIDSLPDCFTPPSADNSIANEEDTEELCWCTPAQLLSEIEAQIKSVNGKGGGSKPLPLISSPSTLSGSERLSALTELRKIIIEQFLVK